MSPVETLTLPATDGYPLGLRLFGGDAQGGPVVMVNGATAVAQRYYAPFARWLEAHGATVITYDYRGIGASAPASLRGFSGRARDWGQLDQESVLRFASSRFAGRPLVLVGHSIGGQLIGMAESNVRVARVLTVAAQVGTWRLWPGAARWALAGLWYGLMPAVARLWGYVPGRLGIGEDLPRGVALEWASWCRHDDYFLGHGISRVGFERLTVPVLSCSLSDDLYAPRAAVDRLHALYSGAALVRLHLTPAELGARSVGHFGFFREAFRATLWERVRPFLLEGTTPS